MYLSIDANLQKAAYHIIEQELAGILLSRIQNALDYDRTQVKDGSDVIIPIGDVYNTFISNEILDMNHFAEEEAGATEKEVFAAFSAKRDSVIQDISAILTDPGARAYKEFPKETQAYMTYIVSDLLTSQGVIRSDAVDTNDATYKAWRDDESINIYTYLTYAISQNWVDTSLLKEYAATEGEYTDSNELYQGMINYILEDIHGDNSFNKLIYRYMIKAGAVTGRQICLMLYEQGVLSTEDEHYNGLVSGGISAYDFVRSKIETLEITPGQLALEPCTGSIVVTDTNSGKVLACVSYPGYDNNRLANAMDSNYYQKLVTDQARPFITMRPRRRLRLALPISLWYPLPA